MSGIGRQEEPSNAEFVSASLVDLVRREIDNVVFVRSRVTWEEGFKFLRLTL